ncbi:UDP-N-acetylglucosamine 4,6-dehydratase [Chitinophaga sp. GCM10012297]|uniref:UDP-N-acetylglucosamine 4,6-dehydratase n=1 Tax=Chitinophaga chungangae TaxID=2821488 RepID=A0ABS3YF11_9BACT|nr:UDP-N-acetylglucosamine 4,6-dehydratase [Chitinophaga chungangae]MBO9153272.1 UDP-N-acetylglucosamine 4,6-dehydratase [Chitinophaga chungangae]
MQFELNKFISEAVTEREESLFSEDLKTRDVLLHEKIKDKSMLVIGGAGTIGSSYIKAALRYAPRTLYVIDNDENGLTELVRDIRSTFTLPAGFEIHTYPIDFGDPIFEKILENEGPFDIVANFAAHKHVRSEKDPYSIEAMLNNNVIKAKNLLDQLARHKPSHFFCVSTDKAANPVNVMGASKKIMEYLILAYSEQFKITTARFANVAFSNGSLPFGFTQRMLKMQPLSSPGNIKRYFVSPQEAGELCLIACMLGDNGDIFFPKLGEEHMKTFATIAERYLEALGYTPDHCRTEEEARNKAARLDKTSRQYPVYFFESDTSGEKTFEEFYTDEEELDLDSFRQLGVIKNAARRPLEEMVSIISRIEKLFTQKGLRKEAVIDELKRIIPSFQHIETGKSLDQRM